MECACGPSTNGALTGPRVCVCVGGGGVGVEEAQVTRRGSLLHDESWTSGDKHAAGIGTVQALVQHTPHLAGACVDAASAHLTLGVMALRTQGEQQSAAAALEALGPALLAEGLLAPVRLSFAGLGTFRQQVLYLEIAGGREVDGAGGSRAPGGTAPPSAVAASGDPADGGDCGRGASKAEVPAGTSPSAAGEAAAPGEGGDGGRGQLLALAAAVRKHFEALELLQDGAKGDFAPHVTIAKTSKLMGWGGGRRGGGRHGGHGRGGQGAPGHKLGRWGKEPQQEEGSAGPGSAAAQGSEGRQAPQKQQENQLAEQEQEQQPDLGHIPALAYSDHLTVSCGAPVSVAEVQLCAMQGREAGGYYPVLATLPLVLPDQDQQQQP